MATLHLDQAELARRWALSPRTLERWRWTGKGPTFLKINGRVVYRACDVEAFELLRLRESTGAPTCTAALNVARSDPR